jgi:lipoyl-dependent peroxiredoxin
MSTTRRAHARWFGSLVDGSGEVGLSSSGAGAFSVSWPARAGEPLGTTSPEELIAAAHATCYAMALAADLTSDGTPPLRLDVRAEVDFTLGTGITAIRLTVHGEVPGCPPRRFRESAHAAKEDCPVSRALRAVPITLTVLTTAPAATGGGAGD